MRTRRTVSCLILAAYLVGFCTPAYADPVETRQITQVFTGGYIVPDIRLRALTINEVPRAEVPRAASNDNSQTNLETVVAMDFSILPLEQDLQKGITPTIETAICDCADLMVPVAGGFPKWPLLFLAGIPLIFIKHGEEELPPTEVSTPTPPPPPPPSTPTPTPEPTSLLLLLTGVCAVGMRLRRSMHSRNRDGQNDDV